jgi:Flp pilus assembly protein TadG
MRRVSRQTCRRGIATVEAAVVLPVILLLVFGFVEVGYLVDSHHVLRDAARQGARASVRLENSNAEVRAAVLRSLNNSISVDSDAVTVRLSKLDDAGAEHYEVQNLSENEQGDAMRVTVTVDYGQFQPPSNFLGFVDRPLSSSAVMQRQK